MSGDGQYIVGTDIRPGTYRTAGPADSSLPNCYWERDKDTKHELSSIIAHGNPSGSAVVAVLPTDKLFQTPGCKEWVKIDWDSGLPGETAVTGRGRRALE